MVRHPPPELVRLAVGWRGEGLTQEVISWRLGVPQGTVSKILKRYQETGQFVQRRRSGRPRISTPREDRVLTRMCLANRFLSATMLRSISMRTIRRRCSIRTVRGRLLAARLRAHRLCRRPALTRRHRQTRRRWAEAHRNWQLGHWRHAVFVDESRFTLYMRDGRVRVRRCPGERLADECVAQHFGNRLPGVSVRGGIHYYGKSELVFMDGTLTQVGYMDIIRNNLLPFARQTYRDNFILIQDNATTHKARRTMELLAQEQVEVMDWPPMSPDMNVIEHVWDYLGLQIRRMDNPPTTVPELRLALQRAWDGMPQGVVSHLVKGMSRRVRALAAARGGHTRYW